MSQENLTTEKGQDIERAVDQLSLLFFQLIVEKNKRQIKKKKKSEN